MERKIIINKHTPYISLAISLVIVIAGVACFYQFIKYKRIASNESSLRQRTEWTIYDDIRNVGRSITIDSVAVGCHFILRFDRTTCLPCIAKAEELLYDVFGKECLTRELCCIGEYGQVKPFKDILYIQSHEHITPMDEVYTPYFCVINDNGDVLFTLSLIPDMYDYNREILIKLKNTLTYTWTNF